MRISLVLPLAALTTALVIPDDKIISQVAIESHRPSNSLLEKLPCKHATLHKVEDTLSGIVHDSKNAVDEAMELATKTAEKLSQTFEDASYDSKAWLKSASDTLMGHGRHGSPNMTVYQLISESKYTTKLAALINEYDDLVQLLNGTAANYTVFAPIDSAFEKIPDDAPKPSKEFLKKVLTYHVSSDYYPAGRVLVTHTVPTLLVGEFLGGEQQRLSTNIGLRGLTVNFYSRIIAVDIVSIFHACARFTLMTHSLAQTELSMVSTASSFHPPRLPR